jgi:DNA-binding MarR family transcriptional regulator
MGYLERQRDPEDERQVRVSLTKNGRRLRERAFKRDLADATGLSPDEFVKVQKAIVTLRNNLIKSIQNGQ